MAQKGSNNVKTGIFDGQLPGTIPHEGFPEGAQAVAIPYGHDVTDLSATASPICKICKNCSVF